MLAIEGYTIPYFNADHMKFKNMFFRAKSALALSTVLLGSVAQADVMPTAQIYKTVYFQAEVETVAAPLASYFHPRQHISGSYTFRYSDNEENTEYWSGYQPPIRYVGRYASEGALSSFDLAVGGFKGSLVLPPLDWETAIVILDSGPYDNLDLFVVAGGMQGNTQIDGLDLVGAFLDLRDPSGLALNTYSLPPAPPPLDAFPSTQFVMRFLKDRSGTAQDVTARLTFLSLDQTSSTVPEPSTLSLMAMACLGIAFSRSRRSKR